MKCPECNKEIADGSDRCPNCGTVLSVKAAEPQSRFVGERLPQAAELAMVGIVFTFISRTVATFLPDLFQNLILAGTNQGLMILAGLAVLWFFISIYREYLPDEAEGLRTVTILLNIVLAGDCLLRVLGLLIIIGLPPGDTIKNFLYGSIDWMSIAPFAVSLLLLIFFILFRQELGARLSRKLRLAAGMAMIGAGLLAFIFSLGLMSYVSDSISSYIQKSFAYLRFAILPVTGFTTLAYVYFISCFRKPLER